MIYFTISICLLIASANILSLGFHSYAQENGVRATGILLSILKASAILALALAIQINGYTLRFPVIVYLLISALGEVRRCWVMFLLFHHLSNSSYVTGSFNR